MTQIRPSVKTRPFACSFVSITIEISGTRYSVDSIDPGEFGSKAYRLTKRSADPATYDLVRNHHGLVECDCPSYEVNHRGTATMCKHGRALTELGLMLAPVASVPPAVQVIAEPCCSPGEPIPCKACVEVPAVVPAPAPAPVLIPDDIEDSKNFEDSTEDFLESDPELWEDGWDDHVWNLTGDFVAEPVAAEAEADKVSHDETPSAGPTAEDMADFHDWKCETTAREHLDHSERLTLAELADRQAVFYRGWNNPAGEMFARAMDALAMQIRLTSATTPDELEARVDVLDREARDQWEAVGYDRAVESMAGEMAGSAFGHSA